MKTIVDFFKFILPRLNKRLRAVLYSVAALAFVFNLISLVIPWLQKQILDSISISIFDNRLVLIFLFSGLLITVIKIVEGLALNKLDISLQNQLQKELLESATRERNKVIDARGPGAYMVNVFGDSEQM